MHNQLAIYLFVK